MFRKKSNGEEIFHHSIKPKFMLKNTFSPKEVLTKPAGVPGDPAETEW